jgi:DNA-binding LacI/PurR family transcriptional regulator
MQDVARLAKVNQSTVSRVLAGTSAATISVESRRRILRVSRSLHYERNPSAVALRTGSTRTVLVVVSDITDSYYSPIIGSIEKILVEEGYSLILHSLVNTVTSQRLASVFHQYRLDGALFLGALPGLTDHDIAALSRRGIPVVVVGRTLNQSPLTTVTVDNEAGGRLAAEHLWSLGHRRIAVMQGPADWPDFRQRLAGFRRELQRRGLHPARLLLVPCQARQAVDGQEATASMLAKHVPTALFCLNDITAFGSIRAIREHGLRVPQDISVIGFDDDALAAFSDPPLTTIRQPRAELGMRGAETLMNAILSPAGAGARSQPVSPVLEVALVVRGSTCRPRQGGRPT